MRYLPLLCTLVFFPGTLSAQFQVTHFGLKAGANLAEIRDLGILESEIDLVSRWGMHAGLYADWSLKGMVSLQTGLEYTQKGGQLNQNYLVPLGADYRLRKTFLALPVLLQVKPQNFLLEGGLEPTFKLSTTVKGSGLNFDREAAEAFWDRNFDLGFVLGLGYTVQRWRGGFRVHHGLIDQSADIQFTDVNGFPIGRTETVGKNQVFVFYLGYDLFQVQ